MNTIHLVSVGAAHGLIQSAAAAFTALTGTLVAAEFDTVGATAAKLRAGAPADVAILSRTVVVELIGAGLLLGEGVADLGAAHAAIAARVGDAFEPVFDEEGLRRTLRNAPRVFVPDIASSTAGQHFAKVLSELEMLDEVADKLAICRNGVAAMTGLAASGCAGALGITQSTEILATPGLVLGCALPDTFALTTIYSAAVSASSAAPDSAQQFIQFLSDPTQSFRRQAVAFT